MNALDIHHLSGAYAADALTDDERTHFETHLAECEACRLEVESLQEAAGRLADLTAVQPPAALRDRVLADIATVRPLPPPVDPNDTAPSDAPTTADSPAPATVTPLRRRRWAPLVAAAAAIAVIGIGINVIEPFDDDSPSQVTSATERVLRADDARSVTMDFPDGATATITRSAELDLAVIETHDMAAAPDGRVYQLWFQDERETLIPAGLMPDGPDNTVLLDGSAAQAQAVGITVEPEGGSRTPTTEPIAVIDLERSA